MSLTVGGAFGVGAGGGVTGGLSVQGAFGGVNVSVGRQSGYRTIDVPNIQLALYQLSIRDPGQSYSDLATYTFPLTPTSIRTEPNSLSTFADTQGPPMQLGVSRIVDTYGLSPPLFTIEGTTGWDLHSADGFTLTGWQSIQQLGAFLAQYAQLNQIQRQAGNPQLYALEFYDYFLEQFWQIEPVGPQILRQSADRPRLIYYRFRWAAIKPVRFPALGAPDPLMASLTISVPSAVSVTSAGIGVFTTNYGPTGIIVA